MPLTLSLKQLAADEQRWAVTWMAVSMILSISGQAADGFS